MLGLGRTRMVSNFALQVFGCFNCSTGHVWYVNSGTGPLNSEEQKLATLAQQISPHWAGKLTLIGRQIDPHCLDKGPSIPRLESSKLQALIGPRLDMVPPCQA